MTDNQSLTDVMQALRALSEGAPFKVERLDAWGSNTQPVRYQVLVENDQYEARPDQGHDPYHSFTVTARTL